MDIVVQAIQPIIDFILAVEWLFSGVGLIINYLIDIWKLSLDYITTFLGSFGNMPAQSNLWTENTLYLNFLNSVPMMSTLMIIISGLICFLGVWATIKIIRL